MGWAAVPGQLGQPREHEGLVMPTSLPPKSSMSHLFCGVIGSAGSSQPRDPAVPVTGSGCDAQGLCRQAPDYTNDDDRGNLDTCPQQLGTPYPSQLLLEGASTKGVVPLAEGTLLATVSPMPCFALPVPRLSGGTQCGIHFDVPGTYWFYQVGACVPGSLCR